MPKERIPRRVWEMCPPGRRGRGRPRNTWIQEIMTRRKQKDWRRKTGMTGMRGEGK